MSFKWNCAFTEFILNDKAKWYNTPLVKVILRFLLDLFGNLYYNTIGIKNKVVFKKATKFAAFCLEYVGLGGEWNFSAQ